MEEIKPLCYETICVGLGLYNTPLAPIIRESPGAPNPPGRPMLTSLPREPATPGASLPPLTPEARQPARPGLSTQAGASPVPTSAQTGPLLARSSRAEVGDAVQHGSWVGWPLLGVGDALRGREGKKALLLPALEEHESPTPTHPPAVLGTSPLSSCSNGSGSRGCADALPSADAHPPPASPLNCQLTGPAARPAARSSCSAARPCARTAHVRARAATLSGREGAAQRGGALQSLFGGWGAPAAAYRSSPPPWSWRLRAPSVPAPLAQRPQSQITGKDAVSAGGRRAAH